MRAHHRYLHDGLCSAEIPSGRSTAAGQSGFAGCGIMSACSPLAKIAARLMEDVARWVVLLFRSTGSVQAENLFLRRQLTLFVERGVRPSRMDVATRVSLAVLAKLFEWRSALVVVQPATMIRWHRAGWRLLWRFKSRPGRPAVTGNPPAFFLRA